MTGLLRKLWSHDEGQDIAEYAVDAGGHSATSGWHSPIDWNERE